MNSQKVQELINKEIAELHSRIGGKAARKQYQPAKWQIAKLTELGILDLMPKGFGHSDADAVIKAATTKGTAVFNAYGEGEEIAATDLNQAIEETKTETIEIELLNSGVVFEAQDSIGNDVFVKDSGFGEGYSISWHKGEMPAHAVEYYHTIEEVAAEMKKITGDLRTWKQVDYSE